MVDNFSKALFQELALLGFSQGAGKCVRPARALGDVTHNDSSRCECQASQGLRQDPGGSKACQSP